MRINLVGSFIRNAPFGTEIAFLKGLQRIGGHQISIIDPSYEDQKWDHGADVTLIFKHLSSYLDDLKKCGGKKVVYQPDDIRFSFIRQLMVEMRQYCDYALAFDTEAARVSKDELGYLDAERLLVTADDELYRPIPDIDKDLDFVFIGSLSNPTAHRSRNKMIQVLGENGFKVAYASDLYDTNKIVEYYNRAKVVLNHATDIDQSFGSGYGYQCRHFEAGFTKSCLLSNLVIGGDNTLRWFAMYRNERELISYARFLLYSEPNRQDLAERFYVELQANHKPEHRAIQMLDFFKRIGA
jgi:spore maturation protein CgeB